MKPKYLIVEKSTVEELSKAVDARMEPYPSGAGEESLYVPHGSIICHPACPPDPQLPFRFSQPMLLVTRKEA